MKKTFITLLLCLPFTQLSLAHSPFLACKKHQDKIQCVGSFSDGSSTAGVKINVIDYSDEVLSEGQLDIEEKITFEKPDEEEFYIKFDAGPGHVFEVDHVDVKEKAENKAETKIQNEIKEKIKEELKKELKAEIKAEIKKIKIKQ